jgi:putative alpha-1,2-mannosidase
VPLGFVPADQSDKSASITLEFAYDDGVLARVAQFLGDNTTFATYHNRSMSYKYVGSVESARLLFVFSCVL